MLAALRYSLPGRTQRVCGLRGLSLHQFDLNLYGDTGEFGTGVWLPEAGDAEALPGPRAAPEPAGTLLPLTGGTVVADRGLTGTNGNGRAPPEFRRSSLGRTDSPMGKSASARLDSTDDSRSVCDFLSVR